MTTLIPKVDVPEGKAGDWEVRRFEVTALEAYHSQLRAIFNPQLADRSCLPGKCTALLHRGGIIMSDTPAEMKDHEPFVRMAHGRVLITGLGMGMVLNACHSYRSSFAGERMKLEPLNAALNKVTSVDYAKTRTAVLRSH